MPFMHLLPDQGMNYTLNRPLLDGTSPARLTEIGAVAPQIKDYDSWHTIWLGLAKQAEAEERWLDAASYYHGAEFYLPAGEARNGLYDDFTRTWALSMKGVAGYERIAVPYPGGHLPGFRVQAKGKEISTFIFHGGYDSFVEEFYAFLIPLTELGLTVIAFDGPGQGGALRQGIYFEHAWEKPAKSGARPFRPRGRRLARGFLWRLPFAPCGRLRAADQAPHLAPRDVLGPRHDVETDDPGQGATAHLAVHGRRPHGDRSARGPGACTPNSVFDWCITQGMHITGTTTPFDFLTAIAKHSLEGILHHVRQDVLLTEGEQDHLFDIDWLYRTMRELVCARSVTARIFTAREGAEQHCQVGNSALAREDIVRWLARFYPAMPTIHS